MHYRADPDFDGDPNLVYYNVYDPKDHMSGKKDYPLPYLPVKSFRGTLCSDERDLYKLDKRGVDLVEREIDLVERDLELCL